MSLFTSLQNATGTLQVYGRVFNTIQNNIANSNTPGYVQQDQVLLSLPFNPQGGLVGGVLAGPTVNARSTFLEQSVRRQNELLGNAQQRATDLGVIETQFDLTGTSGIPNALNGFFNSFSQLAVNPNDAVARQSVLDRAEQTATAFNQAAISLQQVGVNINQQTLDTVKGINRLAEQIASLNHTLRNGAGQGQDAGTDGQLNAALEELAGLANFTVVRTADGAANVYLGGQTILVIGDKSYGVSADLSTPQGIVRDSTGNDVSDQLTGGRLGALLQEKNVTIPDYTTQLNTLAAAFADNVNAVLGQGVGQDGNPAPLLFSYDTTANAAFTLTTNFLTPDQVAAALPLAPGGNGNALAVAQLANQPLIGSFTLTQAFGNLGGKVGRDVSTARNDLQQYGDSLAQARQFRTAQTGVSLDEEAAKLLQFQQAYQAVGKLVGVLSDLTLTVVNLIR